MYSVLIVAYKRPHLLREIVESVPSFVKNIYIHVDLSPQTDNLNSEVIRVAKEVSRANSRISTMVAPVNLGPGRAIPKAITWALEDCESLLILEDDCLPNPYAYEYFRRTENYISENFIICGTSPYDFQENRQGQAVHTTSSYALVSGWMIGSRTWQELNIDSALTLSYWRILGKSLRNPHLLLPLSFFYASIIRIRRGEIQAWDSMFCLSMIMHGIHSLIPNVTVIDNLGFDFVASNTKAAMNHESNVYNKSSDAEPSHGVDLSRKARRRTDSLIEKSIYNLRLRNYLSPAKSSLRAFRGTH